jgi:Phytanoyl-CoA dioxygenase (PhyH)
MDLSTQINCMLTSQQLHSFHTNGLLALPGMIPLPLLNRLRTLFDELMDTEKDITAKVVYENKGEKYVTNLENICYKGNLACLELLGFPPILEIAESICGKDFFLIQEFAVIKNLGDEMPVLWHQDMLHQRSGHCFTMGIYLDDAGEGDGALRVVPVSHVSNKTICELSKEPSLEVPMKAGDILIHDMLLAHSSEPLKKNPLRRVIYFEFLSAAHVTKEYIYSDELVCRRTRLLFAATRYYQSLHPEEEQFIHQKENPGTDDEAMEINEILRDIYKEPIHARPSAYCFESLAGGKLYL